MAVILPGAQLYRLGDSLPFHFGYRILMVESLHKRIARSIL